METINIGIIGGCMTCQTDLKLSQLFFRQLSAELLERDGIKCQVSLRYYNEYFRIREKADHLIKHARPDIIILQVRPAPFIMRSELVIQDYKGHFILNPLALSSAKLEEVEQILGTKDPVILQPDHLKGPFNKAIILPVLRTNITLGKIFMLKNRALKSLQRILNDLKTVCDNNHIRLIIIGTINSYDKMHNSHLSGMNQSLKMLAIKKGIPYLDLYSLFNPDKDRYFGPDRFHLNQEGHSKVADLLYEAIKSMGMTGPNPE